MPHARACQSLAHHTTPTGRCRKSVDTWAPLSEESQSRSTTTNPAERLGYHGNSASLTTLFTAGPRLGEETTHRHRAGGGKEIIVGQNPRSVPNPLRLGEPHSRTTRPPPYRFWCTRTLALEGARGEGGTPWRRFQKGYRRSLRWKRAAMRRPTGRVTSVPRGN
eukprot:scaffold3822_cov142-Isochrysis_galbana.AAC.3